MDEMVIAAASPVAAGRARQAMAMQLVKVLRMLWHGGWQPLDVMHHARRRGNGRQARLAAMAIAVEAEVSGAIHRAPEVWLEQLASLSWTAPAETRPPAVPKPTVDTIPLWDEPVVEAPEPEPVEEPVLCMDNLLELWEADYRLDITTRWADVVRLIGLLKWEHPLTFLQPHPNDWGKTASVPRPSARPPGNGGDPKMLAKIRALLAKAEATTFEEEADAFTAKAQELMARHAIDAAALEPETGNGLRAGVVTRRIHIDDPFGEAKMHLLHHVADANAVKAIWNDELSLGTVFGFPLDLDLVEMLFTSLLVQATTASSQAAKVSGRSSSPGYKRAFILSYASRIGERLHQARAQAESDATITYGSALVPMLIGRKEAVDEAMKEAFPKTSRVRSRTVDAAGWHAGRLAADLAAIGNDTPSLRT